MRSKTNRTSASRGGLPARSRRELTEDEIIDAAIQGEDGEWGAERGRLFGIFHRHFRWIKEADKSLVEAFGSRSLPPQTSASDLLRRCGNAILYDPAFWERMHACAQKLAHPFVVIHGPEWRGSVDEKRDEKGSAEATKELLKVLKLMQRRDPQEARRARSFVNDRFKAEYDAHLRNGLDRKRAYGLMAERQSRAGRPLSAGTIESYVSRARRASRISGKKKI